MNSDTAGLRRSKSASTTRDPRRANAAARFEAVVVFPSPFRRSSSRAGRPLVAVEDMRNVRGQQLVLVVEAASVLTDDRHAERRGSDSIVASTGALSTSSTSASLRTLVSNSSRAPMMSSAITSPIAAAEHRVLHRSRRRLGSAVGLVDEQRLTGVQRLEHLQLLELPVELGGLSVACLAATDLLDRGVDRTAVHLRAPGRVGGGDGVDGPDRGRRRFPAVP